MNRTRMLILASIALVLSVGVTLVTYRVLRGRLQPAQEMTKIVVAAGKVSLGTRLTTADLTVAPWPKGIVLDGSFQDPSEIIGRGVVTSMQPNEPVLESKLAPKDGGAGLMTTIPEGMRAMSVKVNDVIGVAGFVLPGTRVDVVLSGTVSGQGPVDTAKIILENVEVLAAGQNIDRDLNGKPVNVQVVTLLVSPEDAEKLALASAEGRIQLALRNPLDLDATNPQAIQRVALYSGSSVSRSRLLGSNRAPARTVRRTSARRSAPVQIAAAEPPSVPVLQPRVIEVQLIQGTKSEIIKFTRAAR